ncbi:hypothetical protein [Rhodococcus sp. NPDC047139]|uniref:hypothetical protein n=1 Tax=Rhodococcus sp. NPDC047139 TaxID=3155141 RepID=UPI0033C03322
MSIGTDFGAWLLFAAALAGTVAGIRIKRIIDRHKDSRCDIPNSDIRLDTSPAVIEGPADDPRSLSVRLELGTP